MLRGVSASFCGRAKLFCGRAKLVPLLQPYGAAERRRAMRPQLSDRGDPGALYSAAEARLGAGSAAQATFSAAAKKRALLA